MECQVFQIIQLCFRERKMATGWAGGGSSPHSGNSKHFHYFEFILLIIQGPKLWFKNNKHYQIKMYLTH